MSLEQSINELASVAGELNRSLRELTASIEAARFAPRAVHEIKAELPATVSVKDATAAAEAVAKIKAASDAAAAKAAAGEPLTAGEAAAALDGQHVGKAVEKAPRKAQKAAEPVAEAPVAPTPVPAPEAAPAPAAAAPAPVVQPAPTVPYEKLKEKILDLAAKKGRSAVVAALQPFGVERGQDLKPEQYADVFKAIVAAIDAEESLA